ncbi:MAG: cation diffusion facilitator family transporter [Leptospirales bacterium]
MHDHSHNHNQIKNIKIAVILNIGFSIIEFIAGFLTNSMTVLADAFHDLGDALILSFAWFSEKYSNKKVDDNSLTYGLARLPLLSAFTNSLVMFTGSIFILWYAIGRLQSPVDPNVTGMSAIAILGIVVNGAAIFKMKKNEGLNSKVMTLHFFEDVFGWVAVLVISIIMRFYDVPILDPLTSIGITIYILVKVIINLKSSIMMFIQKAPANIDMGKLRQSIEKVKNVSYICDLHVWTLDSIHHIFTAHICINDPVNKKTISQVRSTIRKTLEEYGKFHSTIEIEYESEKCMDKC